MSETENRRRGDNRDEAGEQIAEAEVQRNAPAGDERSDEEKADAELANRLAAAIEDANSRVTPLIKMIRQVSLSLQRFPAHDRKVPMLTSRSRQHIENMDARKEEDRNEQELVDAVKPLLIQAEKILNETQGVIKGADPENKVSNRAKRNMQEHKATPEEQRLAEALKVVSI